MVLKERDMYIDELLQQVAMPPYEKELLHACTQTEITRIFFLFFLIIIIL